MLLRNMGIPCRIAAGFLTENRSSGKNQGWYWYYGNQGHAWVEIYFPGFGWLDFDTTIGNDEAREATQADGTPPSLPQQAPFAITGMVKSIDTTKKQIEVESDAVIFNDKTFTKKTSNFILDVQRASIKQDTSTLQLKNIKAGDTISAVTYNEKLSKESAKSLNEVMKKVGSPTKVDDVFVKRKKAINNNQTSIKKGRFSISKLNTIIIVSTTLLVLLLLLLPQIALLVFKNLSKKSDKLSLHYQLKYMQLKLNQYVLPYKHQSTLEYAQEADHLFKLNTTKLAKRYLQHKYDNANVPQAYNYLPDFNANFSANTKGKIKWYAHFNFIRTLVYLQKHK
jgi:protein-glutamine gamma-glutamyltransferase